MNYPYTVKAVGGYFRINNEEEERIFQLRESYFEEFKTLYSRYSGEEYNPEVPMSNESFEKIFKGILEKGQNQVDVFSIIRALSSLDVLIEASKEEEKKEEIKKEEIKEEEPKEVNER